MAAIQNLSDLVFLLTSGAAQHIFDYKDARVGAGGAASPVAGRLTSLWQYNGARGQGSVADSAGESPDNAYGGALKQTNPAGGKQLWLVGVASAGIAQGTLFLFDRLAAESGNSGTVTTAQSLSNCAIDRYTGSEAPGNQIFLEITTQIGTTATTVTASYTNQDGTSGRTTVATAFGGTGLREAQRLIALPLQAGDTGVISVESVTVLATTGTAGDFTVLIMRPMPVLPIPSVGQGAVRDAISGLPGLIEVKTNACLQWAWLPNTTTVPSFHAHVVLVEK